MPPCKNGDRSAGRCKNNSKDGGSLGRNGGKGKGCKEVIEGGNKKLGSDGLVTGTVWTNVESSDGSGSHSV